MYNPTSNFPTYFDDDDEKWAYNRRKSFYIRTVTFDLRGSENDGFSTLLESSNL
jgi:hypothetical protein